MRRASFNMKAHLPKEINLCTHTLGRRWFLDLLTHLSCVWPSSLLTANTTRGKRSPTNHTFMQPEGILRSHTCSYTIILISLNVNMSTGRVCVSGMCPCEFAVCRESIGLKLTPPPVDRWQQVLSQDPDLCGLKWYSKDWKQKQLKSGKAKQPWSVVFFVYGAVSVTRALTEQKITGGWMFHKSEH